MHRILAVIALFCLATASSFAASPQSVGSADLVTPTLSLRTGPTLYHPAEFSLKSDLSTSGGLGGSHFQPEYSPVVAYDFDNWFRNNATTIAIVAVAILLLIVIAD